MPRLLFATLLSTAVLVGCEARVVPDDGAGASGTGGGPASGSGGGGAASGTGGAGGSEPVPRALPIAYVAGLTPDPDTLMVLINRADGSLVTSYFGSELPTEATVIDGDTVTYAYLSSSSSTEGQLQRIDSFRVTPELERLEIDTPLYFEPSGDLSCLSQTMHVTVHVPAVTDGLTARVSFASGRASMPQAVPGDVEYDLPACSLPGATMPVLVTVSGPGGGYAAFEMIEDVPFAVGSTVELTPTFTTMPRTTLAFDVDDVGDAETAGGGAAWYGMFDLYSDAPMYLFTPNELGLGRLVRGRRSLHPQRRADGPAARLRRGGRRRAVSSDRLGVRPGRRDRSLGEERGADSVPRERARRAARGRRLVAARRGRDRRLSHARRGQRHDGVGLERGPCAGPDPPRVPRVSRDPAARFTLPAGDFTVINYYHDEDDTVAAYADAFATHEPWAGTSTQRSRSRVLVCE